MIRSLAWTPLALLVSCAPDTGRISLRASAPKALVAKPTMNVPAAETRILEGLAAEGFSGAVAVMSNGAVNYAAGIGEAAPGRDFSPHTIVNPESVSKLTTVMAVLRLVQDRRLLLDDPLRTWFPDAAADKAGITVRQLLTHTGGIVDVVGSGPEEDYIPISREEMANKLLTAPLEFAPGSKLSYSNGGYNLLAMIVEKASGESLSAYLQKEVFRRAGVKGSYLASDHPAGGFAWSKINGDWVNIRDLAKTTPLWRVWGAGGLFISTLDLARLFDAFMRGKVVRADLVMLALTPVEQSKPKEQRAFSFNIVETRRATHYIYHNGWGEYFNADFRYYPEARRTIVVSSTSRYPNALRAGREIAEAHFGPDVQPPERPTLQGQPLDQGSPEWRLASAMLMAAAARDEERMSFISAYMSKAMQAREGQGALRALATINAYLRRPRILEARRTPEGATLLTEVINLPEHRLRILNLKLVQEGGTLKIDGMSIGSSTAK